MLNMIIGGLVGFALGILMVWRVMQHEGEEFDKEIRYYKAVNTRLQSAISVLQLDLANERSVINSLCKHDVVIYQYKRGERGRMAGCKRIYLDNIRGHKLDTSDSRYGY